ncbi:HNH endonuclease [Streptomyces marinisediminis]|uniref:HNH endonuclease n=1 Tax=Streptomyces TaxID=1883 RepID=UPI003A4C5C78
MHVRAWFYRQSGRCEDCGARLELQADHVETRQDHGDRADRLENMLLRCRRCNVVRRPSHKQGGLTFLTAEAALMWILFIKRPRTYEEYAAMCKDYGMTMASIRFQEAWAMAHWLVS